MIRKTISFPSDLAERIENEARSEDRSFNKVAVRKLRAVFFGTQTVRQSKAEKPTSQKALK